MTVMSREEKMNVLIRNDIESIEQSMTFNDTEFLWAVLSGDGWVPYNQLTDEQLDAIYNETIGDEESGASI